MATHPERVASLETTVKWQWILVGGAIIAAACWLGWLTNKVDGIDGRVSRIEGSFNPLASALDGLKHSSSPADTEKAIGIIAAQGRIERLKNAKPDPSTLQNLTEALGKTAKTSPDIVGLWDAAGSIATLRNASVTNVDIQKFAQQPDCDLEHPQVGRIPLVKVGAEEAGFYGYVFSNCRLYLDALPGTIVDQYKHEMQVIERNHAGATTAVKTLNGKFKIPIALMGGTLVYKGTSLPADLNSLIVFDSRIEFDIHAKPNSFGRELLLAALNAPDPTQLAVTSPAT